MCCSHDYPRLAVLCEAMRFWIHVECWTHVSRQGLSTTKQESLESDPFGWCSCATRRCIRTGRESFASFLCVLLYRCFSQRTSMLQSLALFRDDRNRVQEAGRPRIWISRTSNAPLNPATPV